MSSQRYQDQTCTCGDCRRDFVWTVGEQEFFHEKGFTDPPKRCKDCRQTRKAQRGGGGQGGGAQYGGGNPGA